MNPPDSSLPWAHSRTHCGLEPWVRGVGLGDDLVAVADRVVVGDRDSDDDYKCGDDQ